MNNSVLVVAAHPDDEVLGCGGTMAKMSSEGFSVHVAFLADGVSSRNESRSINKRKLALRRRAARTACRLLGAKSVSFGDYSDNSMDSMPLLKVIKRVESLITEFAPRIILTHHVGDLNVDHQVVHRAVITACRPQGSNPVKSIRCFEVVSSTEWQTPTCGQPFAPDWFVDISETLKNKLAAFEAYADELREWPHPRSLNGVEALARWRGATIGAKAAEAYVLARHIE